MQPSSGRAWLLPLSEELHVQRQAREQHVFPRVQNVRVERKNKTVLEKVANTKVFVFFFFFPPPKE